MSYDILIVGGGPAGLTAALYAARAGKRALLIEKSITGGQILNSPLVENYPALPHVSGVEFGAALTGRGPVLFQFGGKDPGAKSWPVKVTRKNGRTLYEIAIPFRALGGRPKRFGFVIFDNNFKEKAKAPYWLQFSDGIAGGTDPCKLKMLQYQ